MQQVPPIHAKDLPLSPPLQTYFSDFAANQTKCLSQAMSSKSVDGVFNPACFIHTKFTKKITIAGMNYLQAFVAWLQGGKVKLADQCAPGTVLCNPTCPLK